MFNKYKKFYLFIPLISVYIIANYYPVDNNTGKKIWFTPPAFVFGIVWPILLILIGCSWYLQPKLTPYYSFLTILLSTWTIFFKYNKFYALINIIITLIITLYLILLTHFSMSGILLIPLMLWLSFAALLNYYSI